MKPAVRKLDIYIKFSKKKFRKVLKLVLCIFVHQQCAFILALCMKAIRAINGVISSTKDIFYTQLIFSNVL